MYLYALSLADPPAALKEAEKILHSHEKTVRTSILAAATD
jgi:hypothetical protein